jgi:hypothetical protein
MRAGAAQGVPFPDEHGEPAAAAGAILPISGGGGALEGEVSGNSERQASPGTAQPLSLVEQYESGPRPEHHGLAP